MIFAATSLAFGQMTVTTQPVGFVTITCPSNSDTIVSLPLTRSPDFVGNVASVSGSTIVVSGTTGWTTNQFITTSGTQTLPKDYVLLGPNPVALSGLVSTVQNSATVTGVGTSFTTALHPEDILIINGSNFFTVKSVESNTSLTVTITAKNTLTGAAASVSSATSNPNEGSYYSVVANDATSLTVDLSGDVLTGVQPGTQISVIPYWTLATVFPASTSGTSFTPTTNIRVGKQTQILMPTYGKAGSNLQVSKTYVFYSTLNAWCLTTDPSSDLGNDILRPSTFFIVRNPSTATTGTLTLQGNVQYNALSIHLPFQSADQDTWVALNRPIDVALNNLGLIDSGAFAVTSNVRMPNDTLWTYNYSANQINKQPYKKYFYYNDHWCIATDPNTDAGADVIPAGTGFLIRKKGFSGSNGTLYWENTPNFN